MSSKRIAFLSAISLFGMLSLFAAGLLFLALFFLDHVRIQAINILTDQNGSVLAISIALIGLSIAFSAVLFYLFKGKTLHVELKSGSMRVSKSVVEKAVFSFWKNKIAQSLPQIAILKSDTIEIQCPLALKEKLESMENAICSHVEKQLGFAPKIKCVFNNSTCHSILAQAR